MTVLLVSPDYLSHYLPLSVLAQAASLAGERVVVATGPGLRSRVIQEGYEWRNVKLGPASNTGIVADDAATKNFLAATARGPLATIRFQAEKRQRDLLWQPDRIIRDIDVLLRELDPKAVFVDHVSFGSTLAMYASGRPFSTVVPGHPSQLPVGEERYGVPPSWPTSMQPDPSERASVEQLADRVARSFTDRWNQALTTSGSTQPLVDDAYRVYGRHVHFNSVATLNDPTRNTLLPPSHQFVGPLVRTETLPEEFRTWADRSDDQPHVYVALGTFLSNRADVLAKIAAGLRQVGARAAIATGPSSAEALGPVPPDWIVRPTLPQVGMLPAADVIIHHGGNNSVQEALATGTRQIVLPFSTDQFANASDLENRYQAPVCAPNEATASSLAAAVEVALNQKEPVAAQPLTSAELAAQILNSL